jgi:PspAA-like protein
VIVRIATEAQYRLDDGAGGRLNELDNAAVKAVEGGDEDGFHSVFEEMLELVRRSGQPLGDDELEESDLIMPPPDLTFVEAGEHFSGEGLIPD